MAICVARRYDLTPNPPTSVEKRDLATTCGTFNRYPNRFNLRSRHGQCKCALEQATAIVDHIRQMVAASGQAVPGQQGTTPTDCGKVAAAFNCAGFELAPAMVPARA